MKLKIIILIFVILFTLLSLENYLVLTIQNQQRVTLDCFFVKPGDNLTLSYMHSVEKTEVLEEYIIKEDKTLSLNSVIFSSQGAGLLFDYPGATFKNLNGKFLFEDINRVTQEISIMPHQMSANTLLVKGKKIDLWKMNQSGSCIIKVEPFRLITVFYIKLKNIVNKLM